MKKFKFKLEPLYEYRQRLEELSRRDLAVAMRRLDEEEKKLSVIKSEYSRVNDALDRIKEAGAQADELEMHCSYIAGLKNHISGQDRIIAGVRAELERRQTEYLKASKDKKAIETVKERSFEEHKKEMNRLEQKITDDITSSRFKRGAEQ